MNSLCPQGIGPLCTISNLSHMGWGKFDWSSIELFFCTLSFQQDALTSCLIIQHYCLPSHISGLWWVMILPSYLVESQVVSMCLKLATPRTWRGLSKTPRIKFRKIKSRSLGHIRLTFNDSVQRCCQCQCNANAVEVQLSSFQLNINNAKNQAIHPFFCWTHQSTGLCSTMVTMIPPASRPHARFSGRVCWTVDTKGWTLGDIMHHRPPFVPTRILPVGLLLCQQAHIAFSRKARVSYGRQITHF